MSKEERRKTKDERRKGRRRLDINFTCDVTRQSLQSLQRLPRRLPQRLPQRPSGIKMSDRGSPPKWPEMNDDLQSGVSTWNGDKVALFCSIPAASLLHCGESQANTWLASRVRGHNAKDS
jgi:hypothetical protein